MKRRYVYTAGAMEGLTPDEMTGWRHYVREHLEAAGIEVLDPTRRGVLHERLTDENIRNRIVQQDLDDISQCKVVFADLRDSTPGRKWGTICEIALAQRDRRVVIVLMDEGQFAHPFVHSFATEVHTDIDEAIEATISYFG